MVNLRNGRSCSDKDFHTAIVKLVDHGDETSRLIFVLRRQYGHVRDKDRVIATRELDVVRLAARSIADFVEVEPNGVRCLSLGFELAVIERQRRMDSARFAGDRGEILF